MMLKVLFFFVLSVFSFADEKVDAIIEKMRVANNNFGSEQSQVMMILHDGRGNSVERQLEVSVLEGSGKQGAKTLVEFLKPMDVKGTKFLSWNKKGELPDQWLYMPAVKKVKKISGSGQSGSFMGSEFTYEDIAGRDFSEYDSKLLSDTDDEWVIQQIPKGESGYSKMVVTYSKKYLNPIKSEYFNQRGELIKVATMSDWKQFTFNDKTAYRSQSMEMKNVQTGKSSVIQWQSREIGKKLKKNMFNSNRLNR